MPLTRSDSRTTETYRFWPYKVSKTADALQLSLDLPKGQEVQVVEVAITRFWYYFSRCQIDKSKAMTSDNGL